MVGENFEFNLSQMALKLHLNYLPWLEKILNYTYLKWLKIEFKLSSMARDIFEFQMMRYFSISNDAKGCVYVIKSVTILRKAILIVEVTFDP